MNFTRKRKSSSQIVHYRTRVILHRFVILLRYLKLIDDRCCIRRIMAERSASDIYSLYGSPILFAVNHGIFMNHFDDESISSHTYAVCWGRMRQLAAFVDDSIARAFMLGELFGWLPIPEAVPARAAVAAVIVNNVEVHPAIPAVAAVTGHISMSPLDARTKYIEAVVTLVGAPNQPAVFRQALARITEVPAVPAQGAVTGPADALILQEIARIEAQNSIIEACRTAVAAPGALVVPPEATFTACYNLLHAIITYIPVERRISNTWTVIHAIVAFCKRGSVTQELANRVSDALRMELQKEVDLDTTVVKHFYNYYGRTLTANSAQKIRNRWLTFVPEDAICLRNLLKQAAGGGLITIITIMRAMLKHPNFPWPTFRSLFPAEFINIQAALTEINGNEMFGYNQDLGAAKSTLFKNVAYWCKDLLVRVDGEHELNRYRGWTRNPTNAVAMNRMLDVHLTLFEIGQIEPRAADAAIDALYAAIAQNQNLLGDEQIGPTATVDADAAVEAMFAAIAQNPNLFV